LTGLTKPNCACLKSRQRCQIVSAGSLSEIKRLILSIEDEHGMMHVVLSAISMSISSSKSSAIQRRKRRKNETASNASPSARNRAGKSGCLPGEELLQTLQNLSRPADACAGGDAALWRWFLREAHASILKADG